MLPVSRFDAILCDFDGVLADTEPLHFACWREVLAELGVDLPQSRLPEFIGVSDRAMLERIAAEQHPPIPVGDLWPSYARKQELFRLRIASQELFLPDTASVLHQLSSFYKLAVVSSSARSEVEPPLERAGILPLFQALVCGEGTSHLKPAPDPYLRAAELLQARRPLVVEDSAAGVASGLAAGFQVLRISSAAALSRELIQILSVDLP